MLAVRRPPPWSSPSNTGAFVQWASRGGGCGVCGGWRRAPWCLPGNGVLCVVVVDIPKRQRRPALSSPTCVVFSGGTSRGGVRAALGRLIGAAAAAASASFRFCARSYGRHGQEFKVLHVVHIAAYLDSSLAGTPLLCRFVLWIWCSSGCRATCHVQSALLSCSIRVMTTYLVPLLPAAHASVLSAPERE